MQNPNISDDLLYASLKSNFQGIANIDISHLRGLKKRLHSELRQQIKKNDHEDSQILIDIIKMVDHVAKYKSGEIKRRDSMFEKYKLLEKSTKQMLETQKQAVIQQSEILDKKLSHHFSAIKRIRNLYYTSSRKGIMGWLCQYSPSSSCNLPAKYKPRKSQVSRIEDLTYHLNGEDLKNVDPDEVDRWLLYICQRIDLNQIHSTVTVTSDQLRQEDAELIRKRTVQMTKALILLGALIKTEAEIDDEYNLANSRLRDVVINLKKPLLFDINLFANNCLSRDEAITKAQQAYDEWQSLRDKQNDLANDNDRRNTSSGNNKAYRI